MTQFEQKTPLFRLEHGKIVAPVGVRFYRLSLPEAWSQGWRVAFYWFMKHLLGLGTYGHVSVIVPDAQDSVEYTLTEKGVVFSHDSEGEEYRNDTLWIDYDLDQVLTLIQQWEKLLGKVPVTIESLARALARPDCYGSYGCCTHFISYVLYVPPTTLADELCLTLLDTKAARIVAVKTMSEYGEVEEVRRRSTASVVGKLRREMGLWLVRKCLGLYDYTVTLLSIGEGLLKALL